jgi:hypothetical protein
MAQIFWAATSGTRSRLSHSLALLVYGALARLRQCCSRRSAFFRIATDPSFRLGTQPPLTQDLHSPIPSDLNILSKEQEARHENPHAPEDEQDHTKVVFAKANVIHNDRILLDVDESRIRSIAGLLKPDTTIGELPYN